ncbi:aldehyde dehydrogenase [Penicillium malachiteum]|uniref:Succinate-semialdehyde dehydrogenase, mitochondrial n=1 Tax=Penicillium malachiteum TaxID=1324776 RepID=A0AAD6MVN8_9EURO|nr:aldehyde dehydrogenase [Penicillium malachiteum]
MTGLEQYHQDALSKLRNKELLIGDAFIDGVWVSKEKKFPVYEPSTGTILGNVSNCELADFQKAIESTESVQEEYFLSTTGAQRGALLRKWNDLILANQHDSKSIIFAVILSLENGKPYAEAFGEVAYAASFVSWFAEEAPRAYGHTIPSATPNTMVSDVREPVGVCGIITPWNFPAAMITRKVAPALGAGCTVVIKPPSETPYSCAILAKLAIEAGFPPKSVQVCPTKDRKAATELATNPLVKKISFTGSTGVGKMLATLAAGTLKKVGLELGGNAPLIVFDDADLDVTIEGVIASKFRCSGQTCVCANRIYVQRSIEKEFTKRLVEAVSRLEYGRGLDCTTTQGPLVNQSAVDKVATHISDALAKGAKVEIGGEAPNGAGYFFPPTVLSSVPTDALVTIDETFGPLAAICTFDTEEEVIKLANDTEFGLAGYLFSKNIGRCHRVAARMKVGMVAVNTGKVSATEAPFGGVKASGYGREGSLYGMEEYQVIKAITVGNLHR